MDYPIKLLSTDFDGTLHADLEEPRVALVAQSMIRELQAEGVVWVINTGRELPSLLESLEHARISIQPDYVVTVEREIHEQCDGRYMGLAGWNSRCSLAHEQLFIQIQSDVPRLAEWISRRCEAKVYADAFSPLCFIARSSSEADIIHDYLDGFCGKVPRLTVVRNHIYGRLSHADYNKGSALSEIARRLGIARDQIVAAGDHLNDLPMLSSVFARWLIAPSNAVEEVKQWVRQQDGYISDEPYGYGLARGLENILASWAAIRNAKARIDI